MRKESLGYTEKKELFVIKINSLKTIFPEDMKKNLVDLFDKVPGRLHPILNEFVESLKTFEKTIRKKELIALLRLLVATTIVNLEIVAANDDSTKKFILTINQFTMEAAQIIGNKRKRRK